MIRNAPNQSIGGELINASTGAAFVGTVTVFITKDAGVQTLGSVGSGVCTAEGNGYYTYLPTQAETDGALVAFTFIGAGAIPATVQVATITLAQQAQLAAGPPGPTSTSARTIITDAFQLLGVFVPGETIPDDLAQMGLARLRNMQSSWKLMPLTSPTNVRQTFSLTAGKGGPDNPYTIGPGGDFNTSRPASVAEISGWGLLLAGSTPQIEIPRAMLTDDAFQNIRVKGLSNALWTDAYYNASYAGGLGTIILWPVPDNSANGLFLYRNLPIAAVTTLDASYDLPEGYFEAQSYNLAVRLAAPMGIAPTPDIVDLARTSLAWCKRMNTKMGDLATDPALTHNRRGGYNILTGSGGT
jgi:hypothetical protein